mgnify:CR=1
MQNTLRFAFFEENLFDFCYDLCNCIFLKVASWLVGIQGSQGLCLPYRSAENRQRFSAAH